MKIRTGFDFTGKIYTMADWERDGELRLSPGMLVDADVVTQLVNAVPPTEYHFGIFMSGEPRDVDNETLQPIYDTFIRIRNSFATWKYIGACLRYGGLEPRKGILEKQIP